ncbi:MAG: CPBP family intramembrane metalloprotease [Candidatus Latescibacteria bacterium]|nr:CPBP family intramembrane metalloprotease [Candidatus Latescibacterota bacterium]
MAYPNLKQSIWLVVLFFLISLVVALPIGVLGAILDRPLIESPYVIQFLILASFILTALYAHRRTDRTWSDILLLKPASWQLYLPIGVCVVGLAIVGSDLGNLFRHLIPVPESVQDLFGGPARKETPYMFTFYAMVVQAPLAKEVLFRGVILGGLLAHRTRNRAIVWSALLFAISHLHPWRYPTALILGLVLAWWVVRTGSLLPAIVGHALNNFLIVTSTHLEVFGSLDDFSTGTMLPWWLHVCGVFLVLVGMCWFNLVSKGRGEPVETAADGESV